MRNARHAIIAAVCLLGLVTACSSAPASTPAVTTDVTATVQQATTAIAVLPTPAALQPQPTRAAEPTPSPAPAPPTPSPLPTAPAPAKITDYTVVAGDTLLSIALAHKVSMAAIMLQNDMGDSQVVKLGQVLHIPVVPTWPGESVFWFVYVVHPGEALSTIATNFEVKVDDLVRINQLADASAIGIGQRLVIPANVLTTLPEPTSNPPVVVPQPRQPQADATNVAPAAAGAAAAGAVQAGDVQQPVPPRQSAPLNLPNVAGIEALRAQLLVLYNQARSAAGLAPLAASAVLQASAQAHAEDCAQRGYGSHTGSDGSTSQVRTARAGYTGRHTGENWAWGKSPALVFDAWFNQEAAGGPHRNNILSKRYLEVGFGIAASSGGYYFIADFGAP